MKKEKKVKNLKLIGILVALSAVMFSCLNSDDNGFGNIEDTSWLAFINASPGSESLKYYKNGNDLNTPILNYGGFYGYLSQKSEPTMYTVRTGTSNDLDTLNLDLGQNVYYSIFSVNTPDHIELISYIDNHENAPSGKSAIRFIQLSPDSPPLKLLVEGEDADLGIFPFKQASTFKHVNHGVDKKLFLINSETEEILATKSISLGSGKSYSVFSKGLLNTTDENKKLDLQIIPLQ